MIWTSLRVFEFVCVRTGDIQMGAYMELLQEQDWAWLVNCVVLSDNRNQVSLQLRKRVSSSPLSQRFYVLSSCLLSVASLLYSVAECGAWFR